MGEHLVQLVDVESAYRLWSPSYDSDPNPILALERRVVGERLGALSGLRLLDIGTGTGYWLAHARSCGACAFGMDLSEAMLSVAARKPELRGRLIRADMSRLPFQDGAADLSICSMALGYVPSPAACFREMARVSRRFVVSDLHPGAVEAGWRRRFESAGRRYEVEQFAHTTARLDQAGDDAGLRIDWRLTAHLGEPERGVFIRAGREYAFAEACRVPAILATCWVRAGVQT